MATKTTDLEGVQAQVGKATGELSQVREAIEAARGKAATGGSGLAAGLLKLRERELELERRLETLRRVRDDLSEQTQHAEREQRRAKFNSLKADAKRLQSLQDEAQSEFEKVTTGWLETFMALRAVHRQADAADHDFRALRREFDPHGPGRLIEQVDFPRFKVGVLEAIPIMRMICRDGVGISESIATQVADALKAGSKR